jgi:hypothetical protein
VLPLAIVNAGCNDSNLSPFSARLYQTGSSKILKLIPCLCSDQCKFDARP